MKDFRQRAFVGLVGLVSAGLISFGCSSSNNTTGAGGSNGSGGHTTGTGGSGTGTGGSQTGSGGNGGGAAGPTCGGGSTTPAAAMLITDFSDAMVNAADAGTNAGKITFGTATTVQGGVTTFQNPASTAGTVMLSNGAVTFDATVSAAGTGSDMYPYSGFVVYINGPACVDASTYTGVSFSISGSVGTCGLVFSFNDAQHGDSTSGADTRFTGPAGAYAPQLSISTMVSSTKATIQVPFTDVNFANGNPAFSTSGIDAKDITGVQWQFTNGSSATAPCMGSITVDDVTFYK